VFYDVPLKCNAAPDIGCGSRSKPVLIDLENHAKIREAWLNRHGTVIAVVGGRSVAGPRALAAIASPILARHEVRAVLIDDTDRRGTLMAGFRLAGQWYRGAAVDSLSIEEAGRISETAVSAPRVAALLSEPEALAIRTEIERYLREELVKLRSPAEIEAAGDGWFTHMYGIYVKHAGRAKADSVSRIFEEYWAGGSEGD